jgi:Zn finger protein HypA/HybF involved in hydrogenase expression
MHISLCADKLRCQHCGKIHGTEEWPVSGDRVPFYFQKEAGNYTLKVSCPHCGKDWHVVWDDNPGPIKPLGL